MFALAGVWLLSILAGYTAIFWATGYGSLADAWWVSGSSLLTLGAAPITSTFHRSLAFTEAAIGFGLVALLVSFLPSLYGAFSRREAAVAMLDVRAGTPPSAVEMLIRFERIDWSDFLSEQWLAWETWVSDLDESHTTYPMLVWLRSPVAERSWLTAAGAVLDATNLRISVVDRGRDPRAEICIRSGFIALRRIADFFGIAYDPDPDPLTRLPSPGLSSTRQSSDWRPKGFRSSPIETRHGGRSQGGGSTMTRFCSVWPM